MQSSPWRIPITTATSDDDDTTCADPLQLPSQLIDNALTTLATSTTLTLHRLHRHLVVPAVLPIMEATHSPTADETKARTRSETTDEKSPRHIGDSPASPSSTPSSPPSSTPSLALSPSIAGTTGLGSISPLPSAPFPLATHPTSPALTPAAQPASTGAATGSTVSTGTASDEKRMCVHTCCAANPHVTLFAQRGGQQNHNASLHAHPCPPCDDSCPGRAFVVHREERKAKRAQDREEGEKGDEKRKGKKSKGAAAAATALDVSASAYSFTTSRFLPKSVASRRLVTQTSVVMRTGMML